MYDQPIGINDNISGIRHYAGLAQKGQTCVILSDPDDWKATSLARGTSPWSRVLLSGRVVWVASQFLVHFVQASNSVVY